MRIRHKRNNSGKRAKKIFLKKNLYKLAFMLVTAFFSGLLVKETTVKEYARPVSGIISGTVIKINDGDTLTVINGENKRVKIRLYGIDSPELDQSHGQNAKRFLSEKVLEKNITADILDIDRYKRSVGRVFADGTDINRMMVEEGHAWVYTQFCKIAECAQWEKLQKTAREQKKGLWSEKYPVEPWKWRKRTYR